MELKRGHFRRRGGGGKLLIVPYGIETKFCASRVLSANLLIVPYGIETTENCHNPVMTMHF